MRVLIDTTPARVRPRSGTAVYVEALLRALRDDGRLEVLTVANPRRQRPAGGGIGSLRNLAVDLWWWRSELPRLARRGHVDVVHHPLPPLALDRAPDRPAQVVTLHDLAFERLPECFDARWRRLARRTHRAAAREADVVVAVSQTTANDARELWGVQAVVARHGPGQLSDGPLEPAGDPAHFLYVGDGEPRKNLGTLLAGYRGYRASAGAAALPLVLAGSVEAGEPGVLVRQSPGTGELRELLGAAAALVQPSRYEGFGLTALEALAAGTPVLAARAPGLVEVCGEAALYVGPDDREGWAAALAQLATDPSRRAELRTRGLARADGFSWAASARAHRDAYSLSRNGR